MKRTLGVLSSLALALLAGVAIAKPSGPPTISASMPFDGLTRTYREFIPSGYRGPRPLLIVLHGHFGTGNDAMNRYHITVSAQKYGFVAVAPDGVNRGWADGRVDDPVDDVGFITALIKHIAAQAPIDTSRVYAIGMSNGGIFAQYLACERPGMLAGIGSIASSMPAASACTPTHPTSVVEIDGTSDPIVPFNGGSIGGGLRGAVLGAPATVKLWASVDRCTGSHTATLPHPNRRDATSATVTRYEGCTEDTSLTFVTVNGGGHTWPGTGNYHSALGKASYDLDATDFTWTTLSHT
jgi:polyhydroxybutyrate depolymerase